MKTWTSSFLKLQHFSVEETGSDFRTPYSALMERVFQNSGSSSTRTQDVSATICSAHLCETSWNPGCSHLPPPSSPHFRQRQKLTSASLFSLSSELCGSCEFSQQCPTGAQRNLWVYRQCNCLSSGHYTELHRTWITLPIVTMSC